jgi:hypothetical protein
MFEHDPELALDRMDVAHHGADYREGMRFLATPGEYLELSPKAHWNEAAFILTKSGAEIADRGISHRARHEDIANDTSLAFVPGDTLVDGGTVTDIKAGFYKPQQSETDQTSFGYFGKHPSILVYARARADGARGKDAVGPWHLMGWIAFQPEETVDYKVDKTTIIDDNYGQPYVVRINQGVEEQLSINDPAAAELKSATDEIALTCLGTRQIRARSVGNQALRLVVPSEQLAS